MSTRNPKNSHWHYGLATALFFPLLSLPVWANETSAHRDPVSRTLLGLVLILLFAKAGAALAMRLKLPPVLGELLSGVLLGNAVLLGWEGFAFLRTDTTLDALARIGAVILLFEVGLESKVRDMLKVGVPSLLVAVVGVIAPLVLGYFAVELFSPETPHAAHLFIGATLCATSVGITARVLKDLGKIQSPEAKIVLGAAVIDDVLGLIILAVVTGLVTAGTLEWGAVAAISGKSLLFIVLAIALGMKIVPSLIRAARPIASDQNKVIVALIICFGLAWLADFVGLAAIVGAFAAGLVMEEEHYTSYPSPNPLHHSLGHFSAFFVPLFFVLMGVRVDLGALRDPNVLLLGAILTAVAIAGKQICGLVTSPKLNRLAIGIGMIPRGEVGLIFAGIGKSLGIVDDGTFAAIIIMVMSTTLITPPVLQWAMDRKIPHV